LLIKGEKQLTTSDLVKGNANISGGSIGKKGKKRVKFGGKLKKRKKNLRKSL
jgi:hypothetical protein